MRHAPRHKTPSNDVSHRHIQPQALLRALTGNVALIPIRLVQNDRQPARSGKDPHVHQIRVRTIGSPPSDKPPIPYNKGITLSRNACAQKHTPIVEHSAWNILDSPPARRTAHNALSSLVYNSTPEESRQWNSRRNGVYSPCHLLIQHLQER